jgi:hypothetical protein
MSCGGVGQLLEAKLPEGRKNFLVNKFLQRMKIQAIPCHLPMDY